jgi:hypothetical protein
MRQVGRLLHHGEVSLQGGQPPKQTTKVEAEGNICGGWRLLNEKH